MERKLKGNIFSLLKLKLPSLMNYNINRGYSKGFSLILLPVVTSWDHFSGVLEQKPLINQMEINRLGHRREYH